MNRQKAILLTSAIEFLLMIIFVVLFVMNVIDITALIAAIVAVGFGTGSVLIVIIRKFH